MDTLPLEFSNEMDKPEGFYENVRDSMIRMREDEHGALEEGFKKDLFSMSPEAASE
ncbi:MAG: hypothetical protein GY828_01960, partial [Candidatus Gracilibacteria bacterium]|nr:hypothetical protein [Candidatus Gracilibacteria bacterium]